MNRWKTVNWVCVAVLCLAALPTVWLSAASAATEKAAGTGKKAAATAVEKPDNDTCLGCHGNKGFEMPGVDGKMRSLHVIPDKFGKSVHGKRQCVECHQDITDIPHKAGVDHKVNCVQCHESLWDTAKKENKTKENERLGVVVEQIEKYRKSIHGRTSKEDPSRTNATCYNCHDAHYVYPKGSDERTEWRLGVPNTCGTCHVKQRAEYATSVHGNAVLKEGNAYAAVCSDCHTTHDIADPAKDSTKLVITRNCGNCHAENLKTYTETYHGQISKLGYAHTAKCFDCHGSHGIQRTTDPKSSVHPDNRLETCAKCHTGATKGFVSFEPHATTNDFDRYPQVWLASKLMLQLLVGTFAFFWTHTALWFYREYKDRQQRKPRTQVLTGELALGGGKHYQRFPAIWRIAHLLFALSLMILTLTGMTVFYANSAWAPVVIKLLGGPQTAALIHRVCAVVFAAVFIWHLFYMALRIGRNWKTFQIFGPDSMVPSWQDLKDIISMFKWFFGIGPRPVLERWTYWEKFDYWAPFWGVTIIGVSGVMLWFPNITASVLPGWVFNVAMIFHGEEALLAALFLFTVHFFNNHFRPDKFPLDVVMFTGSMPLEEFRHEHPMHYQRLVETGQLEKYLVDAPSAPMARGARILGFTLIAFGLILLALVLTGMLGSLVGS